MTNLPHRFLDNIPYDSKLQETDTSYEAAIRSLGKN